MEAKRRDLEERTAQFAERVRVFARSLPRTVCNAEDVKQLVRSSGSVAANCIEANESLGHRDCLMKFRLCRKEAKETQLWLRLVFTGSVATLSEQQATLRQEARELMLIFSAIAKRLE